MCALAATYSSMLVIVRPFPGAGGDCAPHWGGEGLPQVSRDGRHVLQGLLWQGKQQHHHHHRHHHLHHQHQNAGTAPAR